MLSLESEVLERHLPQFAGKSVLLFGDVRDDFAQTAHLALIIQQCAFAPRDEVGGLFNLKKAVKIRLFEIATFSPNFTACKVRTLAIYDQQNLYTEEFKALTHDFYLKM